MSSLSRSSSDSGNNNKQSSAVASNQSTSMTTTTTTTAKKKFGKNLNKLTKPPEPAATSETKANAASRNGLLLLSTNKRNNSLLGSTNKTSNAPLPSLGLQYESTASTHDVLLGAVVGAAASRAEQQPDAWGVHSNANKDSKKKESEKVEPAELTPPKKEETPEQAPPPRSVTPPRAPETPATPTVNWDEYGGRETTTSSRGLVSSSSDKTPTIVVANNTHDDNDDEQHAQMAKLARERAERRRQEEAARAQEQKEKAAQRLRALETKLGSGKNDGATLESFGGAGRANTSSDNNNNNNNNNTSAAPASRQPTQQRTLYDPNQGRSYSSFVGSGGRERKNSGGASIASSHDEPRSPKGNAVPGSYNGPVIHLNSYEDRDRGEAPRPAAPRMLFDPKSGSMVAVTSRDEKPKKDNAKTRGGRRGKNAKDDENNNARGKKNQKAKKETKTKNKASKKPANPNRKFPRTRGVLYARDDKGNCYCADGCDGDLGYGAHSVPGGRVKNTEAYAKFSEQQQQLYKKQQQMQEHGRDREAFSNAFGSSEEYGLNTGYSLPQNETSATMDWVKPNERIELLTGMDDESPTLQATAREWAPSQAALAAAQQAVGMPSLGSYDMDDDDEEEDYEDDDDDGAINFEPKDNTAEAAVRAVLNSNMSDDDDYIGPSFLGLGFDPTQNMDSVIQSPSARPDSNAVNQLDGIDFGALGLAPPLGAENFANGNSNNHNHIFAFGSSGTWGNAGNANDWGAGLLGGHNAKPASTSRLFGGVLADTPEGTASSSLNGDHDVFLSCTTPGNTWGSSGTTAAAIPGFIGGGDSSVNSKRAGGED